MCESDVSKCFVALMNANHVPMFGGVKHIGSMIILPPVMECGWLIVIRICGTYVSARTNVSAILIVSGFLCLANMTILERESTSAG